MPGRLAPVSRREFIRRMLRLSFEGPLSGGSHELLVRADRRLIVPNPHRGDISVDLLVRLLDEAGVTRQEWEASA